MSELLSGAIAMAAAVAALFFLRFWRSSGDRFFLYFALSFLMQACSQLALVPLAGGAESGSHNFFYMLRLMAYGLILVAIVGKNRRPRNED